ncbi:hypothetical protein SLEP1_g35648 [Rubroshorea leprosula]|uniref:inositol 3-alpha-galactosyltransferase n=1 Tax=Rubroshorea leprosula TaxID=152421 RepID=A0AAV5KPB3_9ROSI|nr:hypothetical protein SLEP1_g35648 [Rubroshorea leprosula]
MALNITTTNTTVPSLAKAASLPRRAYVTFLAGNGDYVEGVVGLAKGLRKVKSKYPLVVAILPGVPEDHRKILVEQGCIVKEIEPVYPPENQTQFAMAYYVINYSKLRVWNFVEYSKVVYLDGDIQTWSHTPQYRIGYCQQCPDKVQWPAELGPKPPLYFNAGMFVFEPSLSVYDELLRKLKITPPTPFAEQDFLNMFFREIYEPIPPIYNLVLAMLWWHPENIELEKVKMVHYSAAGSKPWRFTGIEQNMDREDIKMLVNKWWDIYIDESLDYNNYVASGEDEVVSRQPFLAVLSEAGILPKRVHLSLTQNNLEELKDIYHGWSTERRREFDRKFGHIGLLLFTTIDEAMLKAAIHFWDPRYRVFVFGEVDMTPTLEEYAALLRIASATSGKIYNKHDACYEFKRKLAKIMGIQVQELEGLITKNGENEGIPWYGLRDFILGNPDKPVTLNAFALAIYGLVLFPKASGYVDRKIVNLFDQLLDNANPIPVILAETFRSLNHCRINGQGRFTGCAQLLTIWLKSHFECLHSEFKDPNVGDRFPIEEFNMSTWPRPISEHAWMENLRRVTATNVIWKAPWMDHPPLLYRCGNYPWVPLLGLWGATAYAPALVRRQTGSLQFMPVISKLDTFGFEYGIPGTSDRIFSVCEAWKNIHRVAAGAYTDITTPGYPEWRANRLRGFVIPEPFEPERNDETDDQSEEREIQYDAWPF